MQIAVIGDYDSQEYLEFLNKVKTAFPEERVRDLSVNRGSILNTRKYRQLEIESSHQVIISPYWKNNIEARWDVPYAQETGKECFIYRDGRFMPFPEYAPEL